MEGRQSNADGTNPMELKYLFECLFEDGTTIIQTPEDVSVIDPARSSFYDVAQRLDQVRAFALYSHEGREVFVDLETGEFRVNGVVFRVDTGDELTERMRDGETVCECRRTPRRLIYARRHTHAMTTGQEASHSVVYRVGWQATVDGKNVQQVIEID
jgi:hypothetical protein